MKPIQLFFTLTVCTISLFQATIAYTQIGGRNAYEFVNLPVSARQAALGGYLIGVPDEDISSTLINPALSNDLMHNKIAFSHNFHFAGIQNGSVAYGRKLDRWGINTHVGVQYINYGDFRYADAIGNIGGNFSASEVAIVVGASKKVAERLYLGANLKGAFSSLESYSSNGIMADFGLNYVKDSARTVISILVRNVGAELSTYNGTAYGTPLDIQIGLTKRLKYLPFRFAIIAHQLHRGDIRYDDPNSVGQTDIFGQPIAVNNTSNYVDNIFRHLIFNGEFLLGKSENLRLRAGYNHLRRKEMNLASFRSFAGFSLGFGIKISIFKLDYGVAYHHAAGATNQISISTDLGRNGKKI